MNLGRIKVLSRAEVARNTLLINFEVIELKSLTNDPLPLEKWEYHPGQFLSLECGEKVWRAYSIATRQHNNQFKLLVRVVENGKGSNFLKNCEIGSLINFKGAFGHFILSENPEATLNFCATGTGIAPFQAMIQAEQALPNPRAMRLYYGGRDQEDIAFIDQIALWANHLDVHLAFSRDVNASEKDPRAKNCRITTFLENEEFGPNDEFYICGNGAMVKSVEQLLQTKKIDKKQIFLERFN